MAKKYRMNQRISFYIRLSALIMVFLFLVIDLITAIYFPLPQFVVLTYGDRVTNYFSYFTTQSNYMVAFYFAIYLYNSYFKKVLPSFQVQLAVTVYITVTMTVFWTAIFTAFQDPSQYNLYNWFNTIILHLIIPISMITSFIFTSGYYKININKWHHNYLWVIAIYPIAYAIIILIRGHLRHLDYDHSGRPPPDTWFPYPFFNIFQPLGWLYASLAFILVFGLVFSLQYLYIWINNLMYKHYQSYEERLETYYLKTLNKLRKRTRRRKRSQW